MKCKNVVELDKCMQATETMSIQMYVGHVTAVAGFHFIEPKYLIKQ